MNRSFCGRCSYDVKLDFKDHISTATIKLEWKHLSDTANAFAVIPSGRLANRSVVKAGLRFETLAHRAVIVLN